MGQKPSTEQDSHYTDLENMSVMDLLININKEDQKVANAVEQQLSSILTLIEALVPKMKNGGRLFYIGAGTSGRLGILDASECPPTFGVDHGVVVGLIAGGDGAIRKAVEFAEDDESGAIKTLEDHKITEQDFVVGIAASGGTPYVIGGLRWCRQNRISTGCITCNREAKIIDVSDFPVVCEVGPEFVTGSTRMKAGTAQKLILNMISTAAMVQLGKVEGNKMVDMQLSNNKLVERGTRMIMERLEISEDEASRMLAKYGSVRLAIKNFNKKNES